MTRRSTDRGEHDRRRKRDSMLLLGTISACGDVARPAQTIRIRNLSATGLMADSQVDYDNGAIVEIEVRGLGQVRGEIIWVRGRRMGITFAHPVNPLLARQPLPKSLPPRLAVSDEPVRRPGLKVL